MERPWRQRLLYRLDYAGGNDSLLLWIFAAASRYHTQRRHRECRFFAAYGRRSEHLLEEQSVPDAALHWRKRFAASAVGDSRPYPKSDGRQHSHRLGKSVRNTVPCAVLDRRRSPQSSNQRRVGDISAWRRHCWKRWNRNYSLVRQPRPDSFRSDSNDGIVEHV